MKKIYLLFLAISVFNAAATAQTTVVLPALKDNSIFQDYPNNSNAVGENFFAGNTVIPSIRRGFIKFDIAGSIPAGSTITSVTLTLYCNLTIAGSVPVDLHLASSNWGEGTSNAGAVQDGKGVAATLNDATWNCSFASGPSGCNTAWINPGGDYDPLVSATTSVGSASTTTGYTWSSVQMKNNVQTWLNIPANNFGWAIIADEATIPSAKRFAARENSVVGNRPSLSVTYTPVVPVKFVSFGAKENSSGVLLNWETAQEFNNAFFSIEHSSDGVLFKPIGRVNGNGTTSTAHTYQFLDGAIEAGKHYYRLAQTDIDGKINYSTIVFVNVKIRHFGISISPNPVAGKLILRGPGNLPGNSYVIADQKAAIVLKGNMFQNIIDVSQLPAGVYYIRIYQRDGSALQQRFIKSVSPN